MNVLTESRARIHPELDRVLKKAVEKSGQKSFRFPQPWEDTATLAANACVPLLERLSDREKLNLRYLSVGTETPVDYAKPTASYVQGMLNRHGYPVGRSLGSFDVKHACAGGSAALLSCAAMLDSFGTPDEKALTVCSDIARYEAPSSAEITQGAGAAALLLETDPRLLELDLSAVGLYSSDVDDFYRPLDSVTARVKGSYSVACYQEALCAAFQDYCGKVGGTPPEVIDTIDYTVLHVPFVRMPELALKKLLKTACGKDAQWISAYIKKSRFLDAMYLNRSFGNLYTASIYVYLAALLKQEYNAIGRELVGKRILMASYGSGNTMIIMLGIVTEKAPELIESWDLDSIQNQRRQSSFDEYLNWLARPTDLAAWRNLLEGARPAKGRFYLKDFDDNGLRLYSRA